MILLLLLFTDIIYLLLPHHRRRRRRFDGNDWPWMGRFIVFGQNCNK